MFDQGKIGKIDLIGFSGLWSFLQQWRTMFQQFDRDRSGTINPQELQQGEPMELVCVFCFSFIERVTFVLNATELSKMNVGKGEDGGDERGGVGGGCW